MEYIFAALIGWSSVSWQRSIFNWVKPRPDPSKDLDKPQPVPWKDRVKPQPVPWKNSLIGAVTGVITVIVLGSFFTGAGMIGTTLLAFAGGKVGADIIGGAIDSMISRA